MSGINVDVLLVGGGVMSATLGTLLSQLDPSLKIKMVERLDVVAHESSDGWNNAGTGHAGYCELNYTPQHADGSIDIKRALAINADFEVTLQLLTYLVEHKQLPSARHFINRTPHQSFVSGEEDVTFLRKRFKKMHTHPMFADMEYSEDPVVIERWMPLVMQQRDPAQPVAATRVRYGSDIDFGAWTRGMIRSLQANPNFKLLLNHPVRSLKQDKHGDWHVHVHDNKHNKSKTIVARFVFLGAGGGALHLLQRSGIPESKGYGGFPVSGQWLICNNPEVIKQHDSKVYGKAPLGAPPMSVPHLDMRIIEGKRALLFGPYAGFSTKFLKKGSYLDLLKSVKSTNLKPVMSAGWTNLDLARYLIRQSLQTHRQRSKALHKMYPQAKAHDWHLAKAGQRVQIIKHCVKDVGKLEFGTEIVAAGDGSLATLLGASPGASIAVSAMIQIIERCFAQRMRSSEWQQKMKTMVLSYGSSLVDDAALLKSIRARNLATLGLG
ncbi:MAG: malate dehydrogenase (quinone) [Gallionella sp.]